MAKYCENCDHFRSDGDGWGKCKKHSYETVKETKSGCDDWK